jgi:preprotein translocase subunit SecA
MNIIGGIAKKVFGNKSDRDIREVSPVVEKVKEEYENIVSLSNDELRKSSEELKNFVREQISNEEKELSDLKERSESDEVRTQPDGLKKTRSSKLPQLNLTGI